jgi:hypothetical protein
MTAWLPLDRRGNKAPDTLDALVDAIVSGRVRLAATLERRDETLARLDADIAAARALQAEIGDRVTEVVIASRFGPKVEARASGRASKARDDPAEARAIGVHDMTDPRSAASQLRSAIDDAGRALREAGQNFVGRRGHLADAEIRLAKCRYAERQLRDIAARLRDEQSDARVEGARDYAEQKDRTLRSLGPLLAAHGEALQAVRPAGSPGWPTATWAEWRPPTRVAPVHLGWLRALPDTRLGDDAGLGDARLGVHADLRSLGGVTILCRDATRAAALGAARGLIARLLAAIPPGKALFTFFDPLGLGQAVAPFLELAEHDPKLVGGKVWTRPEDLRARLAELTGHIEVVIQKYLRGDYGDIDAYNDDAGEIAEPYRILVVFDFPGQFDETCTAELARIVENGPRCGVLTIVVANADAPAAHGVSVNGLPGVLPILAPGGSVVLRRGGRDAGPPFALGLDDDPLVAAVDEEGQAIIDRIVDAVGRAGRGVDDVTVTFERSLALYADVARADVRPEVPPLAASVDADDPATWWPDSSAGGIGAPLGRKGARDVAVLRFDSEIRSGALLVGRPGAGKSTLLHTYVAGLCTLYDPDELELYLVDFKEGVEFKAYAETALPHARCVAVESEREFGLSVLESIVAEMRRRAELIRATGGQQTSFARLRGVVPGPLPRLLLVFDEFHVLFAEDDRLGAAAADLLETIIRQGRGFGVHVLLGSQSLSGLDALGRHVLQLLPIRLLLPSSESDAAVVLGDDNEAWKLLSRRGEGVLNAAGGAVEANEPFQTAFSIEDERLARLGRLRSLADARGFSRRPVVFEGYAAARIDATSPTDAVAAVRTGEAGLALHVGAPMTLGGPVVARLRRESGANALVVAKAANDVPRALLVSLVASALASQPGVTVQVVDFTSVDEGVEQALGPLIDLDGVTLSRRRQAGDVLTGLAAEVSRRVSADDVGSPARLLVLFGLHRARDLDPARAESLFSDDVAEPDLLGPIKQVLVDGPEFGVHTVAWVDSVAGLTRRLPPGMQREFALRIAGAMSRDDSIDLLDVDLAAGCRPHQVIVVDDVTGAATRSTTYALPDPAWLAGYRDAVKEAQP